MQSEPLAIAEWHLGFFQKPGDEKSSCAALRRSLQPNQTLSVQLQRHQVIIRFRDTSDYVIDCPENSPQINTKASFLYSTMHQLWRHAGVRLIGAPTEKPDNRELSEVFAHLVTVPNRPYAQFGNSFPTAALPDKTLVIVPIGVRSGHPGRILDFYAFDPNGAWENLGRMCTLLNERGIESDLETHGLCDSPVMRIYSRYAFPDRREARPTIRRGF